MSIGSHGAAMNLVLTIKTLMRAQTLEDLLLKHMIVFKGLAWGVGSRETPINEMMNDGLGGLIFQLVTSITLMSPTFHLLSCTSSNLNLVSFGHWSWIHLGLNVLLFGPSDCWCIYGLDHPNHQFFLCHKPLLIMPFNSWTYHSNPSLIPSFHGLVNIWCQPSHVLCHSQAFKS